MRNRLFYLSLFTAVSILTCLAQNGISNVKDFDISKYGAIGDGKTLNTVAIQSAIDKCASNGGGTLLIPQGDFLSGSIFLKPGVNLHLDKGAVLHGSINIADYPEKETRIEGHSQVWIPALVNASHVDHLRIDGEGTICGGGKSYWDSFWAGRAANKAISNMDVKRPRNIFIEDSNDVQISRISLRESGFWNLHLFRCQAVSVKNVDIRTPLRAPSTDGIDVDGCQNVTIEDCYISVDDDNIALKGSKGTSALDDATILPDDNIHISNCTFGLGNAALTFGSEATTVHNVVMENCKLTGKEKNCLLSLKLRPDTQQDYENLVIRNISIENPQAQLISIKPWTQFFDLQGKPAPDQSIHGITLSGITGSLKSFGQIDPPAKSSIQGVLFQNINITCKGLPVIAPRIREVKFDDITINGAAYPAN